MGKNSERVTHDQTKLPSVTRGFRLDQILNDIMEEEGGKGFSKIVRIGPFVSLIEVWTEDPDTPPSNPDAKLRSSTTFNRTGPFVNSFVKSIYDEDTGTIIIATSSTTVARNASNFVTSADVTNARTP